MEYGERYVGAGRPTARTFSAANGDALFEQCYASGGSGRASANRGSPDWVRWLRDSWITGMGCIGRLNVPSEGPGIHCSRCRGLVTARYGCPRSSETR